MRIFILLTFAFCFTEASATPFVTPVQGNINAYIEAVGGFVFGHHLIGAKKVKISQLMIEPQRQSLSKFELAIVRCCSSTSDGYLDRCFALNGFGAIGFSVRPCQFLNQVLEKLNQKRK